MSVVQDITTTASGVVLTSANYANPVTVTATGTVTNGMRANSAWTVVNQGIIAGSTALNLSGGSVANSGTITGTQIGVLLNTGTLTNAAGALIMGGTAVAAQNATTVTNFGTIDGTGGTAVDFTSVNDVLVVEAGSTLIGTAVGHSGTLVFDSAGGAGTVSGLGAKYANFSGYTVASGADWTLTGTNTLALHGTLADAGTLTVSGTLAKGTLVVTGSLTNTGSINSGVTLGAGGVLDNTAGAIISAASTAAIYGSATGVIANYGLIADTIGIQGGTTSALTVTNFGTIDGTGGQAVAFWSHKDILVLEAGSSLIGTASGGGGTLAFGGNGTEFGVGSGTLSGSVTAAASGFGTYLVATGADWVFGGTTTIVSGQTLTDAGTLTITGTLSVAGGIAVSGSLDNAGSINGGVALSGGALVTNQVGATISSSTVGVSSDYSPGYAKPLTVTNDGAIVGATEGVALFSTASVLVNDSGALISGGINGIQGSPTIFNAGTIEGTLINGAYANGFLSNAATGLIRGHYSGVAVSTHATADNAGIIGGISSHLGVYFGGDSGGAAMVNRAGGLIEGTTGIAAFSAANTVANYGTIKGLGGTAVYFKYASDLLVLEAGSKLIGSASGGGGTLAFAGVGSESGIGSGTLAGSAPATVSSFATYAVLTGADWMLAGSNTIGSGKHFIDAGTVTIAGALLGSGTVSVTGALYNEASVGVGMTVSGGGQFSNATGATVSVASGAAIVVPTLVSAGVLNNGTIEGATYGVQFFGVGSLSNTGNGLISGRYGVAFNLGTLRNDGTILGTDAAGVLTDVSQTGTFSTAVTIKNDADALIQGRYFGVYGRGTVLNTGTIRAAVYGIDLTDNAFVSNSAGGLIAGYGSGSDGVGIDGTLINAGTIEGSSGSGGPTGVLLDGTAASVTNQAGGFIEGGYGVKSVAGGTVVNYGTIVGEAGKAVLFIGTIAGTLVIEAGSTLIGTAVGNHATLDFAAGGGSGTIASLGNGGHYSGFNVYQVNTGADWTFAGSGTIATGRTLSVAGTLIDTGTISIANNASLAVSGVLDIAGNGTLALGNAPFSPLTIGFAGAGLLQLASTNDVTISGFSAGDAIAVANATYHLGDTASYNALTHQVTLHSGASNLLLNVQNLTLAPGDVLGVTNNGGHDQIQEVPCFCRGTLILTPDGEVPVEKLKAGDRALTMSGEAKPITWIGVGHALAIRGRRTAATPVIVRKNALGDNIPCRDLRITKGHALYIDDALIPVECLVNHRSILWDDHAQGVTIYHVELATHDVLVANGAPAESYRDDGNRWLFQNANQSWDLPPLPPYAPVLTGGPIVDAVWRRLLDRAGPRPGVPLTDDADLHLLVDGERIDVESRASGIHVFRLPEHPHTVRIVSRAGAPAELGLARDPRVLGVAVRRIELRWSAGILAADASDGSCADGFHEFEADNDWRWTNGNAGLPETLLNATDSACMIVVHVACTTRYPLSGEVLDLVVGA